MWGAQNFKVLESDPEKYINRLIFHMRLNERAISDFGL